jgi:hypothetical protein
MMAIQKLEDLAQARIHESAPRAVAEFKASVRPIYGLEDNRLAHVGTCLLLNIDGSRVVSTAAHVVDNLAESPLFVGGLIGSHPLHLQAKFRGTSAPGGDRRQDHFDSAYCVLAENEAEALGGVEFLGASRISHNRAPTNGRVYTAFGYAISRNKNSINHPDRSITNRLSMYTGQVVDLPAVAAKLPHAGQTHLAIHFDRYAYTTDGDRMNAFGPRGLSGGALLDLGDFTSPSAYAPDGSHRAALSGMLIEHWTHEKVMIAVRIEAIVEGIRRDLTR